MCLRNLVFLVDNFNSLAPFLKILGFSERLHRSDFSQRLYQLHEMTITVIKATTSPELHLIKRHGSHVREVWFDFARPLYENKSLSLEALGVTMKLITPAELHKHHEAFLPPQNVTAPSPLSHVDHIAINIQSEHLEEVSEHLVDFLGLFSLEPKHIQGGQTSFTCSAFQAPGQDFFIVINTSQDPNSQIQDFLNRHQGPGLQHIAFHADPLETLIPDLKAKNIPFIEIPESYYQDLEKIITDKEHTQALQKACLLYEKGAFQQGFLKQTFTREMLGPLFFEFITRQNLTGFGEKNITALFRAVEENLKNF